MLARNDPSNDSHTVACRLEAYLGTAQGRLTLFENQEVGCSGRGSVEICRFLHARMQVRYHVGSIMRHRRYNYVCVITGWDAEVCAGVTPLRVLCSCEVHAVQAKSRLAKPNGDQSA